MPYVSMSPEAGSWDSVSAKSWEQRVEWLELVPTVARVERVPRQLSPLAWEADDFHGDLLGFKTLQEFHCQFNMRYQPGP